MGYLLLKEGEKKELYSATLPVDGYSFYPKKGMKVKQVVVLDPSMVDEILTKKIEKQYIEILKLAQSAFSADNDEDAETGTVLALDEISLARSILLNRYQNFLKKEKEEKYLKKLRLLENKLRMEQVLLEQKRLQEESRGRGR